MKKLLILLLLCPSIAFAAAFNSAQVGSNPVNNYYLQTNGSISTWAAVSASGSSYPFPLSGNATSTLTQFNGGLTAYGTSTIGNTTQGGGLTISGGATTTGQDLHLSSTTLQAFTGTLATTSQATTTDLYVSNIASTTKLFATNAIFTAAFANGGGAGGVGTNPYATTNYVQSRGQNLITNGSGLLGNNYNFSAFTFDPTDTYSGGGSFKINVAQSAATNDELIPVDPTQTYTLSAWGKSGDVGGGNYDAANSQYLGIVPIDIDGNSIQPYMYSKYSGSTDTTLASTLHNGDTTMSLTSATGWFNGSGTPYSRNIVWYPYTNNEGYSYPNYTYSRNASVNYSSYGSLGLWAAGGISGTTVTLTAPWAGPTLAAGTAVRNNTSGGTYKYISASAVAIPNSWTNYNGYIGGLDVNGTQALNLFPYGTAYVKVLFLINYQGSADNNVRWNDISFSQTSFQNLTAGPITSGLINGQTISSSANFTGTVGINSTISNPTTGNNAFSGSITATGVTSSGAVVANSSAGFQNNTYLANAANPIWHFANATSYGMSYYQDNGAHPLGVSGDAIGFDFGTIGSPPFFVKSNGNIYSGGNVGIGTISPSSPLTANSNAAQLRLETNSDPTNYNATLAARYDSSHPFELNVDGNGTNEEFMGVYADGGFANPRVVFPNGNVGIGTTSPTNLLTVAGSANFGVNGNFKIYDTGANNISLGGPNMDIATMDTGMFAVRNPTGATYDRFGFGGGLAVGSAYSAVDASDGNLFVSSKVGIGTTNPWTSSKLDVEGSTLINNHLYVTNQTGGGAGATGSITLGDGTLTKTYGSPWTMDNLLLNNGGLMINNGSNTATISTNGNAYFAGNVGIGTTSPLAQLSISNFNGGNTDQFVVASSSASLATTTSFIVNQYGNVGIGTTNPLTKLQSTINPSGTISGINDSLRLQVGGAGYNDGASNNIVFGQDAGGLDLGRFGTAWNIGTSQMNFVWSSLYNSGANTTELMRLTGAGNLGIGTTNPQAKLDVQGTASSTIATTTEFFGAGLTTCNTSGSSALTYTGSTGTFGCNSISGGSGAPYPFQGTNNSTSTLVGFTAGLYSTASTTLQNFTALNSTSTNATTTTVYASGTITADNFYDTSVGGNTCVGESGGFLNTSNCVSSLASSGSTLTVSSPTGNVNVDLNLGHSNTWTVAQMILASTTIGNSTTSGGLTIAGTATSTNLLVTSSTTLQNFTAIQSTSTNATTTSLGITGLATPAGSFLATDNNGSVIATSSPVYTNPFLYLATTSVQQLATSTLSLASSTPALNGKDNLSINISIPNLVGTGSSTAETLVTFNGDSGASSYSQVGVYPLSLNINNIGSSLQVLTQPVTTGCNGKPSTVQRYIHLEIVNATTTYKMGSYTSGESANTLGMCDQQDSSFVWYNTTSRITQINVTTTSNATTYLATGTEMTAQAN